MIRIHQLEVRYPGFTLGPLTLEIGQGERVALVGPNGAGKSTLLRAICGLTHDYIGAVRVAGEAIGTLGPRVRTLVGVLPERLLGFGWMTVADHLRFLAFFHPGWDASYAEELSERLGLPSSRKLANLSKGMQVKLSFVAAEAFRPKVLLLDEPTSGIDPLMRGEILALIADCAPADGNRTVIFSSHLLEDVGAVARRVLILRDGRLQGDLGVDELAVDGGGSIPAGIYRRLTRD